MFGLFLSVIAGWILGFVVIIILQEYGYFKLYGPAKGIGYIFQGLMAGAIGGCITFILYGVYYNYIFITVMGSLALGSIVLFIYDMI